VSEDPFDDLDPEAHRDREGDPFESLDSDVPGDETPSVPATGDSPDERPATEVESDPFEYVEDRPAAGDAFGDVDVSRGDPFEGSETVFERVDVDSVDPDAVWDRFTESAERTDEPSQATLGGEAVPEDAPDTVTVPKRRFCQTCPYFTAPPETSCAHEGTEIRRFVGTDDVRVSNCPVVTERRELGETYTDGQTD
jgi:hypothetical protein